MSELAENVIVNQEFKMPVVKLGITAASIKKLAIKYPSNSVPDVSTKDGMLACKSALREISSVRINLEKKRKELVSGAINWQKKVNGMANEFKGDIAPIETPYREAKNVEEERVANEKKEAEEAEERRLLTIESKVEEIQELTSGLLNADLSVLEDRLSIANDVVIDDSVFMEFVEPATMALNQVKAQLTNAVNTAKQLAAQQAEIDERQKVLDNSEREQLKADAERHRIMNERQAEMDRQQKEMDEREAEAVRLEAERKADIERQEAEKAEETRLSIEQEEADKQRIIDDKKTAKELKKRLPEDRKLQDYVVELSAVTPPDLNDPMLCSILREIFISLSDMKKTVFEKTQKI